MLSHCQLNMSSIKKAWMTSEIFTNWLHPIDKKITKKRSIVMIVDNCPAHPHVKISEISLFTTKHNKCYTTNGPTCHQKLHYRKLTIQKIIRAIVTKTEFVINVLDALCMLNHA